MARVTLTNRQRAEKKTLDLMRTIRYEMAAQKKTQKYMGEIIGITGQGFGKALMGMTFTTNQLMEVLEELGIQMKAERRTE